MECTRELSNTKRFGRPKKTPEVDFFPKWTKKKAPSHHLAKSRTHSKRMACHCQNQQLRDTVTNVNTKGYPWQHTGTGRSGLTLLAKMSSVQFWSKKLHSRMMGREGKSMEEERKGWHHLSDTVEAVLWHGHVELGHWGLIMIDCW